MENYEFIMEVIYMILFTILLFTLIAIIAVALVSAIIGGLGFAAVFGDAIVFVLLVWLIIKIFRRKKE